MTDKQILISYFQLDWFPIDWNTEFIREIVEHPHIVIASKKIVGHSFMRLLGDRTG
jgi:hypothetical protein